MGNGIDSVYISVAVLQAIKEIKGGGHREVTICTVEPDCPGTAILEPGLDPRVEYIARSLHGLWQNDRFDNVGAKET